MSIIVKAIIIEDDLKEIWSYIAQDSTSRANTLLNELDKVFHILAENPLLGRARAELASDLRGFPVGAYMIFYQPIQNGVEIIRVLHSARDVVSLFGN